MASSDPLKEEADSLERSADPVYGTPGRQIAERVLEAASHSGFGCCPRSPRLLTERVHRHFQGVAMHCPTCGEPADVVGQFRRAAPTEQWRDLRLVGERSTHASFPLPEEGLEIRLEDLGIPDRATILKLTYNSQLSIDMVNAVMTEHGILEKYPHGGKIDEDVPFPPHHGVAEQLAPFTGRQEVPRVLRLHRITPTSDESPADTEVRLDVHWIDIPALAPEWQLLASAFLGFRDGMLAASVLWASTAIESRLYGVLRFPLEGVASRQRVERFLTDEATFSSQLQVLLPFVVSVRGWPSAGSDLLGQANRLRKLRNDAAHKTHAELHLDPAEVGQLLCSATLVLHYLGLVADLDTTATIGE